MCGCSLICKFNIEKGNVLDFEILSKKPKISKEINQHFNNVFEKDHVLYIKDDEDKSVFPLVFYLNKISKIKDVWYFESECLTLNKKIEEVLTDRRYIKEGIYLCKINFKCNSYLDKKTEPIFEILKIFAPSKK